MKVQLDSDRLDLRDPRRISSLPPFVRRANRHYFRLRTKGLECLDPMPALDVGNHNGGLADPDLSCTLGSLWETLGPVHAQTLVLAGQEDALLGTLAPRAWCNPFRTHSSVSSRSAVMI